jgi:hypothetical protein
MINGIWLVILGVLGASSLIIARRPDAAEMIGKLAPIQGWMGAVSALWGVWGLISSVLSIGLLTTFPIWWITSLASSVVLAGLGLLLGVGVMKTFIKDPTANAKMDETIKKLSPFQGTLGLVGIGLGIWTVLASFMFMG